MKENQINFLVMKPTPGQTYTTKQGDTVEQIAAAAYGSTSDQDKILDVNQLQVPLTGTSTIPTGTKLIIPPDTELDNLKSILLQSGLKGVG